MIPVHQTILHDPANGKHGNCMSAVLASLLHIPIETVPTFGQSPTWIHELNEWLRPRGLAYLSLQRPSMLAALEHSGVKGCYHEVAGPSPRMEGVYHACVGLDGAPIFDPMPPGSAPMRELDTCGLFIAIEPWRVAA